MVQKERADKLVVDRGLAESRHKAQALIMAGLVYAGRERVDKPGQRIPFAERISLKKKFPYVGRGGMKLREALDAFGIDVKGMVAADLGASTGGFTDCLLQSGAKHVYAIDVDTTQLDWRLRKDSRVILIEKNARYLNREDFQEDLNLVTMDLAFISILKVLPAIRNFLGEGNLLSLLKPQFEVGKREVGKKGIVRDPTLHQKVLLSITRGAAEEGFELKGLIKTSLRGQKGNREFFAWWTSGEDFDSGRVKRLVKEVVWDEKN